LLDGLDEVKDLARRPWMFIQPCWFDFFTVQRQRANKFILTSRIVGYNQVRRSIEGLIECTLVDFGEEEIALFIKSGATPLSRLPKDRAAGDPSGRRRTERAAGGDGAQLRRAPLSRQSAVVTVLALMKRQGVRLPERRVELYEQYVDILLRQWNLARSLGRTPEYSLTPNWCSRCWRPWPCGCMRPALALAWSKEQEARRKLIEIYSAMDVADPERASELFLADVRDHANPRWWSGR